MTSSRVKWLGFLLVSGAIYLLVLRSNRRRAMVYALSVDPQLSAGVISWLLKELSTMDIEGISISELGTPDPTQPPLSAANALHRLLSSNYVNSTGSKSNSSTIPLEEKRDSAAPEFNLIRKHTPIPESRYPWTTDSGVVIENEQQEDEIMDYYYLLRDYGEA